MERTCDLCDRKAVVHETLNKGGQLQEIHLCEHHAREAGLAVPAQPPLQKVLTQIIMSKKTKAVARVEQRCCPTCGRTFAQFRQSGVLGCPGCYETFEKHLAPLLERTHDGAIHHIGKTPKRTGAAINQQLLIQRLAHELDAAVAAEHYERAADLRDRIKIVEMEFPGVSSHRAQDCSTEAGA